MLTILCRNENKDEDDGAQRNDDRRKFAIECIWSDYGHITVRRKRIFPLVWGLNIDFEIEHFAYTGVWNGIGARVAHPPRWRSQKHPGWFWDIGLDGRRLGAGVHMDR
jgi:hypothetical protein